jgi:hypothetical protein
MVVHGLKDKTFQMYGIEKPYLYDFSDRAYVAVAGLYYARSTTHSVDQPDPVDVVWRTARSLWEEKERVL